MNAITAFLTFFLTAFLCTLPRRYAVIPLLLSATYITRDAGMDIGSVRFTVLHITVLFGLLRVLLRREGVANGWNAVDKMMTLWAIVLIASSPFHSSDQWAFRIGVVWKDYGCYLLLRCLVQDIQDIKRIFKALCVILVPVALLMMIEKSSTENFFAALGGVTDVVIRDGNVRAKGPFAHPILAGTVGAACLSIAIYLWNRHRGYALLGLFSGSGIVYACASSGPIMMLAFIIFGLMLWKMHAHMRAIRRYALISILALNAVMHDPVYFLMARIDLSGGSTGWYRARLIQSSIEHLSEWWLVGTDYTRHWMETGTPANDMHADIVNQLLAMGIKGGLLLILLYVLAFISSFKILGSTIKDSDGASVADRFLSWTLGSILFGYMVNFLSVSLFDQSLIYLYLILAATGAVQNRPRHNIRMQAVASRPLLPRGCAP